VAAVEVPPTILRNVYGFRAKAANLELILGYALHRNGLVELYCSERIGTQSPTVWRNFMTTRTSALDAAECLCADVEEYLDQVRSPRRPSEDLDLDDFLEHLGLAINNNFT